MSRRTPTQLPLARPDDDARRPVATQAPSGKHKQLLASHPPKAASVDLTVAVTDNPDRVESTKARRGRKHGG